VALSCFLNECYKECSKAFVKLERLTDVTEKEREQYELLAINLFSRHPPHDKPKKEFNCPKRDCKAQITEL
jgi:WD repeat-containing protein 35